MKGPGSAPRLMDTGWGGILGDEKNRVYLSPKILKNLGLHHGSPILLKLGIREYTATVNRIRSHSTTVEPIAFVSPDIAATCQIPTGRCLTLKYFESSKVLAIGPLIGLFTVGSLSPNSLYGAQEQVLAALTGSSGGLCGFVFTFCSEDIDWDNALVTGKIPTADPQTSHINWTPLILPLPNVIYDRIPTRSCEARQEVQETKSIIMNNHKLPYFNPRFLDKWETHLLLQNHPAVSRYLPPTKLVESSGDLASFLQRYPAVFLKPSSGSLGRRVIKLRADERGHYQFMYRSRERQTKEGLAADFTSLQHVLKYVMGQRPYIVQKDLQLAKFGDNPFDIRVLAQKDRYGHWRRTKIYVRKAASGSFLANLSDGGQPQSIAQVLKEVFNEDFLAKEGLGEEIRKAVRLIPRALEEATGMTWGELGIDLGLDRWGSVWLIEVNSKPFRTLVSQSGSLKIIERSLMRPLEFAKRLAGFYRP